MASTAGTATDRPIAARFISERVLIFSSFVFERTTGDGGSPDMPGGARHLPGAMSTTRAMRAALGSFLHRAPGCGGAGNRKLDAMDREATSGPLPR